MKTIKNSLFQKKQSRKIRSAQMWIFCCAIGGVIQCSTLYGGLEDRDEKTQSESKSKEKTPTEESSLEKRVEDEDTENKSTKGSNKNSASKNRKSKNSDESRSAHLKKSGMAGAMSLKNKFKGGMGKMNAVGGKLKGAAQAAFNQMKDGAALKAAAGVLGGMAAAASAMALMNAMKGKASSALCYGGCSAKACSHSLRIYNICMSKCPPEKTTNCRKARAESHPEDDA